MCDKYKDTIVITNRSLVSGDFLEQMEYVIGLHPNAVILREKDLSDAEYEALARNILKLCREAGVSCFLHSRIEAARKLNCTRLHLSVEALKAKKSDELTDMKKYFHEISVSCHSMEDMEAAVKLGATQIVLGTIFETDCKKGLKGKGLEFVKEICEKCSVPVYAIGGINMERLSLVIEAGAAGGCMMSGFMKKNTIKNLAANTWV